MNLEKNVQSIAKALDKQNRLLEQQNRLLERILKKKADPAFSEPTLEIDGATFARFTSEATRDSDEE